MQAGRGVGVGRSAVLFSAAIVVGMATGTASLHAGARQDERVERLPRPVIYTSVGQDESPRLDALQPIDVTPSNLGRTNPLGTVLRGAVGPDHYVQTLGSAFAIFDKAGAKVYPQGLEPTSGDTLWQGFGGTCENTNSGNLTVLYDRQAGRWMMSQLAASGNSTLCIAISQTSDPTGPWFRYAFAPFGNRRIDNPHFGVWPDGYYMTVDQSLSASPSAGAAVVAFERERMLAGLPARAVYFDRSAPGLNAGRLLPSDLDGAVTPPDGSPNYFVQLDDEAWGYDADQLEIFEFHVEWNAPSRSTFSGPSIVDLSALGIGFDSTPERLIHRLAYRNFGDHESLVFDHSVNVNGADHAGIRWYELRSPGSAPAIYQAGTYAPDADNRWNGSIAMDAQGNVALAYAVSSESTSLSVRYAGRLAGDPLGTLPQDEITLGSGSVSRAFPSPARGEFGSVMVDPADDCTFWLMHGYIQSSDDAPWQTRIASFKFPSCAPVPSGADEEATTNGGEAAATDAKFSVAGKASCGTRINPAAGETSVTLAWDANTEPDVAGYEVSYGTQSMVYSTVIDAGNVTNQPLAISPGAVYYFAVRAYTSSTPRLYSPYSAEVSYTAATPAILSLVAKRTPPVDLDGATSSTSTFPFTADGVSSIVWKSTASGGIAPLQYQFQRFSAATRLYTIVQDWSIADTFVWTPTPAETGRYFIRVYVRSNGVTEAQASRWTSGFEIR